MKKILTLCVIHQHPRVLLGMKKRGFGAGRWNGFGGKLQEGETIEAAARREVKEEVDIEVQDLRLLGILTFTSPSRPDPIEMHIFKTLEFIGEPSESEEMRPEWFDVAQLPWQDMWSSDAYWYDLFLADKKFVGKFEFDANDQVLEHTISEVEEIFGA